MNKEMPLKLYNSDGRRLMEFVPLKQNEASLYCCGPTVYNFAHIGNLRTYIFEDILHRILQLKGYKVSHVMNITDVGHLTSDGDDGEDKMIKSAREKGMSVWDIASFFTDAFFEDTKRLGIIKPAVCCKATDHINEMIELVSTLEKKGFAYMSGGNVYFDTSKFASYGKMAQLDLSNLLAGSRVDIDSNKKNPADFVLWFTDSKFENQAMIWDSPWGKGYPGWHIECSAMSMKYLGESFDIHCGGIDHIPVHHTNEIAQSEAATGKKWVNYWVHGEFLVLNKGKMSKSGGSFITLQTLIDKGFDPLDYRYFCLTAHYRSQLQFSFESIESASSARKSLKKKVAALKAVAKTPANKIENGELNAIMEEFYAALNEDMAMPRALASLYSIFKCNANESEKLAAVIEMEQVLALGLESDSDLSQTSEVQTLPSDAQEIFNRRLQARANKDYALSDKLRDELLALGIVVKDSKDGTTWNFK